MTDYLQEQYRASHLSGGNAAYVEELYEQWLDDPFSVPEHWQQVFSRLGTSTGDDTRHLAIAESFRGLKPAIASLDAHRHPASVADGPLSEVAQHVDVQKHIAIRLLRDDETEAARRVEPLYLSGGLDFLALGVSIVGGRGHGVGGTLGTSSLSGYMFAHSHTQAPPSDVNVSTKANVVKPT